jgi:hypothetical protein
MFAAIPLAVVTIGALVGFVIGLCLAVLILRSACDLCDVPAPGFLKALVLMVAQSLISGAIGAGIGFGLGFLSTFIGASQSLFQLFGVAILLLISALIAVAIYMPTLRIRFTKALSVWGWQTFISAVVFGVAVMLLIGGISIVEGVGRLT